MEKHGESFTGPVQFAPDGVSSLASKSRDLVVTQLFVSDEQQQQAIFGRQTIQSMLYPLAKFLGFKHTKR